MSSTEENRDGGLVILAAVTKTAPVSRQRLLLQFVCLEYFSTNHATVSDSGVVRIAQ
jgi:hypothetical protein